MRTIEKYTQRIYLSKQYLFDADPKGIQQINFTGSLAKPEG